MIIDACCFPHPLPCPCRAAHSAGLMPHRARWADRRPMPRACCQCALPKWQNCFAFKLRHRTWIREQHIQTLLSMSSQGRHGGRQHMTWEAPAAHGLVVLRRLAPGRVHHLRTLKREDENAVTEIITPLESSCRAGPVPECPGAGPAAPPPLAGTQSKTVGTHLLRCMPLVENTPINAQ